MKPLDGTLVVDASRMLPGAVLARVLLELGARLIKVEDPGPGDPLRYAPPLVDGTGAGFHAFYAGSESLRLDLRRPNDARALLKLARHADVLVESFRPGSLERWGLGVARLQEINPALVICHLSAFGATGEAARLVGHDLDLLARTGLLGLLSGDAPLRVQLADVSAGTLAASAVLGALLARARDGRGRVLDQPLVRGTLPFLTWPLADAAAGGGGVNESEALLTGGCPAYRVYACADRERLAVGALEPKLWAAFASAIGLPELAGRGLEAAAEGRAVARQVAERLATRPREHWLQVVEGRGLPVTPVQDLAAAAEDDVLRASGVVEAGPRAGAWLPSFGPTAGRRAPRPGEHDRAIADQLGLELSED